jgi:hypothetical protein
LGQIGPFGTRQVFLVTETAFELENLSVRESRSGSFLPAAGYDHSQPSGSRRRRHPHLVVVMVMMHLLLLLMVMVVEVMVKRRQIAQRSFLTHGLMFAVHQHPIYRQKDNSIQLVSDFVSGWACGTISQEDYKRDPIKSLVVHYQFEEFRLYM